MTLHSTRVLHETLQTTDLLDLFEQHTICHEFDPGFFSHVPFIADLVGDNTVGRGRISGRVMSPDRQLGLWLHGPFKRDRGGPFLDMLVPTLVSGAKDGGKIE